MGTPARLRCVMAHLGELYRNRALVANLVQREVAARYKRSVLGFLWTLLTPLMSLAVYWLIFTKVAASISMSNYAVFLFAGLLPWTWLSSSLVSGANSITTEGALITRICLPPQVLPAVMVLTQMVHFLLSVPIAFLAAVVGLDLPELAFGSELPPPGFFAWRCDTPCLAASAALVLPTARSSRSPGPGAAQIPACSRMSQLTWWAMYLPPGKSSYSLV